ncbi:3-carboxyethylcatechol 2,3-dioxygenase [Pseudothauera rhizosphaerae]|uniref:2,3-dihydroxyphenylpropionate/2,3-dihydroxicinnamic acid 1,2-dioxygenase n=1 Tax=Pseudothauera rhizosphaerae TaxID=2565932 RepID=A0A4S4AQW5_9RHOO|nr:3-carboxyethylcatechol 2,3-dioxygenase [Pseudothauera rhizosphaerae]THF62160.1 3-carboxyethylcatechol 2,3-dioxygenase [Pseudothauera rhizosphaerae]
MSTMLQCMSHTPIKGYFDPPAEVVAEVAALVEAVAEEVERFDPQVIYLFAPDHYNGFFLDLMPPFCIGMAATSVGDYTTPAGPLSVPRDIAEACAEAVIARDIDIAFSYRMQVDHGFAQTLQEVLGGLTRYPVVPIMMNAVAPPLASFRRARQLGAAIGDFARGRGQRALFVASGGMSHNPPIPRIATATDPEVIERIVAGRNPTPEARDARQQRTVAAARAFAAGESELHPLAPAWDRALIRDLCARDWSAIDAQRNEAVTEAAGASAHELRTWVAATAAMDAASGARWDASERYYRPIPEWLAGFGAISGYGRATH